jgi:hypothetical protein
MELDKFVPYDKLSKKAKKEYNQKRRNSWGETSPVTRIVPKKGKNQYNRQRAKQEVRLAF